MFDVSLRDSAATQPRGGVLLVYDALVGRRLGKLYVDLSQMILDP